VDRENCTVRHVKLCGWTSLNNRQYDPDSCSRCAERYNGAFVNIDHGRTDVAGRFGRVVGGTVVAKLDGLYGDVKYNPMKSITEEILWTIENDPTALGMSHDVDAKVQQRPDGSMLVTEIVKVRSVDIVSEPATTKGLFESMETPLGTSVAAPGTGGVDGGGDGDNGEEALKAQLADLVANAMRTLGPDKVKNVMKHVLGMHAELTAGNEPAQESVKAELVKARADLEAYKIKEQLASKRVLAANLCKTSGLPDVAITETFLNDLVHKDDVAMKESIADRLKIVTVTNGKQNPTPTSGGVNASALTLDAFTALVNGKTQK
jgi:hypothetical protein